MINKAKFLSLADDIGRDFNPELICNVTIACDQVEGEIRLQSEGCTFIRTIEEFNGSVDDSNTATAYVKRYRRYSKWLKEWEKSA